MKKGKNYAGERMKKVEVEIAEMMELNLWVLISKVVVTHFNQS